MTNVAKSPTKTCQYPRLDDVCRTLSLDVSKIALNGEVQYTFDIIATTDYNSLKKKVLINVDVSGVAEASEAAVVCGNEELVLQSPSSPKDISLYYEDSRLKKRIKKDIGGVWKVNEPGC